MSDDGPGAREVAYRIFAAEFDDASLSYSESDEERAPNYVVTPTGARVNRLFAAGVLTEVERINDDTRRGRVVDPTGAFVTYAGQYQPDAQTFLERSDPPAFVALTGKARTFEPEDSDRVFTSIRPESINHVDADVRDRWIVTAAETTLDRLAAFEKALDSDLRGEDLRRALEAGGAPAALAAGIPRALEHYRTSPAYVEAVRRMAIDALELVSGDREEVRAPDIAPDEGGHAEIGALPETDVSVEAAAATASAAASESDTDATATSEPAVQSEAAENDAGAAEDADSEGDSPGETGTPLGASSEGASADEPGTKSDGKSESEAEAPAERETKPEPQTEPEPETEREPETQPKTSTETVTESGTESPAAEASDGKPAGETLGNFDESPEGSDTVDAGAEADAETGEESVDADADAVASNEMYELDEEEREEIEAEYGTEFSTGGEVEEADIDVPDVDDLAEDLDEELDGAPADAGDTSLLEEPEGDADVDADDEAESDAASGAEGGSDGAADVDLTTVAVETMEELDDGDGADREAVAAAIVDEYGAGPEEVADAIEDALMGGQCYEPTEGTLKAI